MEKESLKFDPKEVIEEGIWVRDYLLRATEDGMFLYVEFDEKDKDFLENFLKDWRNLKIELKALGFCGILEDPLVKSGVIFVGRGKPAEAPQPSLIEFLGEFKKYFEDPAVFSKGFRKFICVKKDQAIGKWIPAKEGIPGKDVFCREVPPPKKTEEDCQLSNELFVDEKGYVRAKVSGVLLLEGRKLRIEEEYEVRGDVDHSIGNIRFCGKKLTINGDVKYGFKVEVEEGDLELNGGTENKVYIFVKGNFECSGIIRGEETLVIVKGDAKVKAVEFAKLEVEGELLVNEYLIFSNVQCLGEFKAVEGKGMVYGGEVKAKGNIELKEAGNETQTPTKIIAGHHPKVIGSYLRILQEKLLIEETLKKLQKGICLGNKLKQEGKLDEKKKQILRQIEEQFELYTYKLESLEERLGELRKEMAELKTRVIKVWSKVYPGVTVGIADSQRTIAEETQGPIKFKLEASIIQISSLK
ncbi:MAG: DUF342 domain-containing protein [Thermodesulfobacteria bacterium]|nr:DUF342 domain-containing protein [Thermodesulfobacteriota bacterium]